MKMSNVKEKNHKRAQILTLFWRCRWILAISPVPVTSIAGVNSESIMERYEIVIELCTIGAEASVEVKNNQKIIRPLFCY